MTPFSGSFFMHWRIGL